MIWIHIESFNQYVKLTNLAQVSKLSFNKKLDSCKYVATKSVT